MEHNHAQGNPQGPPNPNQSLDYESWVNSLGSIQDGIFQNTPMTSHILQHSALNGLPMPSNVNGPPVFQPQIHDVDIFYNSPERFYRDVINESPIVSRTPQIGRTPLRNLSINFSTPNFLRNIDAAHLFGSATKGLTPLKNQQFTSSEFFRTPHENKENSTSHGNTSNLNSSPTTIKMGSSAVKVEADQVTSKILPPSPTPGSKISGTNITGPSSIRSVAGVSTQSLPAPIPKMGCFKKTPELESRSKKTLKSSGTTSNFQIIMTDVNSFANNSKPLRKKKKLARSSTTANAPTKTITKKSALKRTLSQPHSRLENILSAPAPHGPNIVPFPQQQTPTSQALPPSSSCSVQQPTKVSHPIDTVRNSQIQFTEASGLAHCHPAVSSLASHGQQPQIPSHDLHYEAMQKKGPGVRSKQYESIHTVHSTHGRQVQVENFFDDKARWNGERFD